MVTKGQGAVDLKELPSEYLGAVKEKPSPSSLIPPKVFEDLNPEILPKIEQGFNLSVYIEELENKFIVDALKKTNNNKNQAAKLLGLNRTTLVERIKKRGLLIS